MQIFGTRFWGFGPTEYPFAGFTYPGSRDNLIARSRPGDLLLILGTKGEETAPEVRGQLLGLIEFERTAAFADDFIQGDEVPAKLLDENGRFKWPYAVPAIRAWEFTPPRDIWSVLGRQLTMAATTSVDQLTPDDVERVLALPRVEIPLPPSRARTRAGRIAANRNVQLDKSAPGQPGPAPAEWSALVAREDGPTATYVMRFGKRNVWKIGISKNPKQRLETLNFSVPVEVLNEQWNLHAIQKWESGLLAYEMEQTLFRKLTSHRTTCERVSGDQKVIDSAWNAYIAGID